MTLVAAEDWQAANQSRLTAALAEIKTLLRQQAERIRPAAGGENGSSQAPEAAGRQFSLDDETAADDGSPTALAALSAAFGLSGFERNLLLLCAGVELDSAFAALCAAAQGDPSRTYPTFSLALAALPEAHWSALTPDAPLRRWRLLEVGAGAALTVAPLRIDERILHYLAGVPQVDERLAGLVEPIASPLPGDLAPSQAAVAGQVAAVWNEFRGRGGLPLIQLCGLSQSDCRTVAAHAAAMVGLRAMVLAADLIPTAAAELDALLRLWEREATLSGTVLLLECDAPEPAANGEETRGRASGAARFLERVGGPVIVSTREPRPLAFRSSLNFDVHPPKPTEQRAAWREAMAPVLVDPAAVDAVASQFSLSLPSIRAAAAEVHSQAAISPGLDVAAAAWQACRARCRTKLDGLAQRLEPAAGWDDLVLPDHQTEALRQIALHVRHRATVYETWGFAAKSSRGLGIAALFAGTSGTGKTMAAEVLAAELRLDLYRIDLASIVSKYIGETEKNLRKVFDAADASGAILLFDEADALFGKRSEVKDSHDRYANIEVSYLLQRIEAYRGLAILTTNLKSSVDSAFLRRLRFVIQFPFPDDAQRTEIWRRVFPRETPLEGIEVAKLARLNIAGGNIRNIALAAAFVAASTRQPVRMKHLLTAARGEYAKLERPLTEAETAAWV